MMCLLAEVLSSYAATRIALKWPWHILSYIYYINQESNDTKVFLLHKSLIRYEMTFVIKTGIPKLLPALLLQYKQQVINKTITNRYNTAVSNYFTEVLLLKCFKLIS